MIRYSLAICAFIRFNEDQHLKLQKALNKLQIVIFTRKHSELSNKNVPIWIYITKFVTLNILYN